MVEVTYSCRENDNPELVHFVEANITAERAKEIIINYPWKSELEWFEKLGEGGGFHFLLGDASNVHAYYQFTPVELHTGFLSLDIVLEKGFLGVLGRKSKVIDFDAVSIKEAIPKIQELFSYSISELYDKYKN